MEIQVIEDVSFEPNRSRLKERLRIRAGSPHDSEFGRLVAEAARIGRPKAAYGLAYVEDRSDDTVLIDGVRFTSRVLAVNLEGVYRVFPFAATCGRELDDWAASLGDVLLTYWSEAIRESALTAASRALHVTVSERHDPGNTSTMSPGSLGDWPLREQRQLFELLGDATSAIGVRLTDSCLMVPTKSVSGIRFPTETRFESCQLCPRTTCPGRRAPYDASLFDRRYRRRA